MAKKSGAVVNIKSAMIHPDTGGEAMEAKPAKPKDVTDDYEVKNHLATLAEAHGIMNDPKKMARVKKLAGIHKKVVRNVQDLKDMYQDKYGGPGGGPQKESASEDEGEGLEG